MKLVLGLLILIYFVLLYCSIKVMYKNELKKYTKFKMMTSVGFLLIGLLSFLISKDIRYFYFLPGYIFCSSGDLFLAIAKTPNGILKKKKFLFGLVSFGLAHLFFILGIAKMLDYKVGYHFLIFAFLGFFFIFISYKKDKYEYKGKLMIPCFIYATLVSSFVGMAFTYLLQIGFNVQSFNLFFGSICFMISDMILSFKYFGKEKKKWYIVTELLLYYLGMLILSTFTLF